MPIIFSNERKEGDEFGLEGCREELGRIEGKETAMKIYEKCLFLTKILKGY